VDSSPGGAAGFGSSIPSYLDIGAGYSGGGGGGLLGSIGSGSTFKRYNWRYRWFIRWLGV
jgi:hypothetical protein